MWEWGTWCDGTVDLTVTLTGARWGQILDRSPPGSFQEEPEGGLYSSGTYGVDRKRLIPVANVCLVGQQGKSVQLILHEMKQKSREGMLRVVVGKEESLQAPS